MKEIPCIFIYIYINKKNIIYLFIYIYIIHTDAFVCIYIYNIIIYTVPNKFEKEVDVSEKDMHAWISALWIFECIFVQ